MEQDQSSILAVIERLQAGQASAQDLLDACDEIRRELERSRAEFEQQILQEPETVRPALAPEIEYTFKSFDLYHKVLDSLAAYAQDFETSRLSDALDYIPNCVTRLKLDFLRFREAALAQRGPTTHPGINTVYSVATLWNRGECEEQQFCDALEQELNRATDWLEQDLAASQSGPELQQFYESLASILQDPPPQEDLDLWLESLVELGKDYARLDLDSLRRRFAYGPSQVPWINMLVHVSWLITQDSVSPSLLRDLLFEAATELEKTAVGLTGWEESGGLTADAGQLLNHLHEWVGQLDEWLDEPQSESQTALAEQGLSLAKRYFQLQQQIEQQTQPHSGAHCLVCGNPTSGPKCGTCGARVHAAAALNPDESLAENRIEKLLSQAELILRESGDRPGFEASLQDLREDLRIAKAKDPGPQVAESLLELRQRYLDSLETFEKALDELSGFSRSPSVEALEAAQEPLRQSVEELLDIQKGLESASRRGA